MDLKEDLETQNTCLKEALNYLTENSDILTKEEINAISKLKTRLNIEFYKYI